VVVFFPSGSGIDFQLDPDTDPDSDPDPDVERFDSDVRLNWPVLYGNIP